MCYISLKDTLGFFLSKVVIHHFMHMLELLLMVELLLSLSTHGM